MRYMIRTIVVVGMILFSQTVCADVLFTVVYSTAEINGKKIVNIADVTVVPSETSKESMADAYVAKLKTAKPDQFALFKDRQVKLFASDKEAKAFRENLMENSTAAGLSVESLGTPAQPAVEGTAKVASSNETSWPFDTKTAKRRQSEAAAAHDLKIEEKAAGLDFILIPPGEFMMGSPLEETGRGADEILHPVKISKPFYLTRNEMKLDWATYDEVKHWLAKLQAKAPAGFAFRLPTEAEWEYAARAGKATPYHTGELMYGAQYESPALNTRCEYKKDNRTLNIDEVLSEKSPPTRYSNSGGGTFILTCRKQPPESSRLFPPNAWGLYDMPGRLSELVEDKYAPYTKTINAQIDPLQKSGTRRVIRGGNFKSNVVDLRSASRKSVEDTRLDADVYYETIGVRLVMFKLED